jgi:ATP-dependent helicase/nuclease subunit A
MILPVVPYSGIGVSVLPLSEIGFARADYEVCTDDEDSAAASACGSSSENRFAKFSAAAASGADGSTNNVDIAAASGCGGSTDNLAVGVGGSTRNGDAFDGVDGLIAERLAFVYPFEAEVHQKSKYSVSELNRGAYGGGRSDVSGSSGSSGSVRLFLDGSLGEELEDEGVALTAAERGTALHRAFEKLDYPLAFAHRDDAGFFDAYLDDLVAGGFLRGDERAAVPALTIMRYAQSALFERAALSDAAGGLRRETPFNYRMVHEGRPVIVQGIIDCFFLEDGAYVLIDFKSGAGDRGDASSDLHFTKVYGGQLAIYKRALSDITGNPVREAALYLMSSGRVLPVSV